MESFDELNAFKFLRIERFVHLEGSNLALYADGAPASPSDVFKLLAEALGLGAKKILCFGVFVCGFQARCEVYAITQNGVGESSAGAKCADQSVCRRGPSDLEASKVRVVVLG